MGRYVCSVEVTGYRSAHNSPQDAIDRAAWEALGEQVRAWVAAHPELEQIVTGVYVNVD